MVGINSTSVQNGLATPLQLIKQSFLKARVFGQRKLPAQWIEGSHKCGTIDTVLRVNLEKASAGLTYFQDTRGRRVNCVLGLAIRLQHRLLDHACHDDTSMPLNLGKTGG
tara:strand:+ start:29 stop:358 length:330 start_codon:yes stop_codon:yes gene_type:complete